MNKYLELYRIIGRNFGFRLRPLGTFGLLGLRHLLSASGRGLDHLLAPGFRELRIERPVFILGNPRSGTTFLHRFLLHSPELCAFELWEMLLPAITGRRALGRVVHHLAPLSPARYHASEAHETSLRDVETDDAMAFFRFVDGGFLWAYFLAWEHDWDSDVTRRIFAMDDLGADDKDRLFGYLESCWRRNLYAKGAGRIIVKSSQLGSGARTLMARYPDARIVYLVRDPVATIPSGMSLLTGVLDRSYDIFETTDPARRARYLENLYQASCHMYRTLLRIKREGIIPPENLRIVTYPQLMRSLEPTLEELVDFLGLSPGAGFWERVRAQAALQRAHQSAHHYSLEKFGLDEARIRSDLADVYREFDVA